MKRRDEIERASWRARKARIVRVAREEPDMPLCLLAERFGETEHSIRNVLQAAGVRREFDGFSWSGRRRSA